LPTLSNYFKGIEDTPEFLPESKSPYYSIPTGQNSCYFDQAHSVLKTLASAQTYSYDAVCRQFVADYGPGTPYDLAKRQEFMRKRNEGNMPGPHPGKWLHGGMIGFLERYDNGVGRPPFGGSAIKETDGFCIAIPVIAAYPGTPDLAGRVEELITSLTTLPKAVTHGKVAAKILEKVVLEGGEGGDFVAATLEETRHAFPTVAASLDAVYANLKVDHVSAVQTLFGSPCYNPGSFQGRDSPIVKHYS
jgi:hypothetical protein